MGLPDLLGQSQNRPREEITYLALKELATSQTPVGRWRLTDAIAAAGIAISETTASRLLRALDQQGLAQPAGVKSGHVITDRGRRELAALDEARLREAHRNRFLEEIRVKTVEDVLHMLVIRRAVEVEATRLAARRATEEEIERIGEAIQRHREATAAGGHGWEENSAVHLAIARASQSRAYRAVLSLILQDRQVFEIQVGIQRSVGSVAPQEHSLVLEGIRNGRPEDAAAAMRAHVDRMIRAVEGYVAAKPGESSGR